jgi:hypothetical protein
MTRPTLVRRVGLSREQRPPYRNPARLRERFTRKTQEVDSGCHRATRFVTTVPATDVKTCVVPEGQSTTSESTTDASPKPNSTSRLDVPAATS